MTIPDLKKKMEEIDSLLSEKEEIERFLVGDEIDHIVYRKNGILFSFYPAGGMKDLVYSREKALLSERIIQIESKLMEFEGSQLTYTEYRSKQMDKYKEKKNENDNQKTDRQD